MRNRIPRNSITNYTNEPTSPHHEHDIMESTTYIHADKLSFQTKAIQKMFGWFSLKEGGKLMKLCSQTVSTEIPDPVPKQIRRRFQVHKFQMRNCDVWSIGRKSKTTKNSSKAVLYLHGGVYVLSLTTFHWHFVARLVEATGLTVVVPDYPLAPGATCTETFAFVRHVYDSIACRYKSVTVMGDSAGGGLALALALDLAPDHSVPPPRQVILLSPWLDVTMSNPEIQAIDSNDKIMGIGPLRQAGGVYAGKLPLNDYRVSPLYGDMGGLSCPVAVFIGTYDLFWADAKQLQQEAKNCGAVLHYYEYPKLFHGWFLLGHLKESKVALSQICELLHHY